MTQRNRRSFTKEFKHEAASLVVNQGYSMAEACRAMGVGLRYAAGSSNSKVNIAD